MTTLSKYSKTRLINTRIFTSLLLSTMILFTFVIEQNQVYAQEQIGITRVAYNPDGTMIAVSGGVAGCDGDTSRFAIPIYSASTGQVIKTLSGMDCTSLWLDWSPDGSYLLSLTSPRSVIYIWDVATGELILSFPTGTQGLSIALWSPNGEIIASSFGGNGILLWDANTGQRIEPASDGTTFDWSPDGTQIVLGSQYDNYIIVVSANTREEIAIFSNSPDVNYSLHWSPDGSHVASVSGHDNAIIWDSVTGEIVLSLVVSELQDIAWSPDSTRLATASNDGTVRIWDAITGEQLEIFQYPGRVYTVDWSPTGDYIVFGGFRNDGQAATIEIEFVGLTESISLLTPNNSTILASLPNNAQLALEDLPASVKFRANSNPATVGSVSFALSGSATASFTDDTQPYDFDWIPAVGSYTLTATPYSGAGGTGTAGTPLTITFTVINSLNRILYSAGGNLYLTDAQFSSPQLLRQGIDPAFSPDGSKIAYASQAGGDYEIYVMNSDGSNPIRLTNNSIRDRHPSWSPDGTRIVFASVAYPSDWELKIINADGTNLQTITNNTSDDRYPAWSPTANLIAFSRNSTGDYEIHTINSSGGANTRLTTHTADDIYPAWSPDGTSLVWTRVNTNTDIFSMNANGGNQQRLTNDAAIDEQASFSQDGTQIIFISQRSGNGDLYLMNLDGSNVIRLSITGASEEYPAWGYP